MKNINFFFISENELFTALDLLLRQAQKPSSQLKGHDWTVQYLQRLGSDHMDLITDYAGWVLKAYPEDGLKVKVLFNILWLLIESLRVVRL